jgi:uncharacterized MnhB-related membrane protein
MVHVPAALHAIVLVSAALLATAVALTRNTLRQIVVNGVYGLVLVILFVALQAPDVAFPLIVIAAIARTRSSEIMDEEKQE